MDTFAKLRGERKGVEWVRAVVNLRMSSSGRRLPCWRAAVGRCRRPQGSWASHPRCFATGVIGAEGGNAGPALRPNTPASAPHSVPDPAAEISRLRRENDRLRMERDILKKTVAIFLEPPK